MSDPSWGSSADREALDRWLTTEPDYLCPVCGDPLDEDEVGIDANGDDICLDCLRDEMKNGGHLK